MLVKSVKHFIHHLDREFPLTNAGFSGTKFRLPDKRDEEGEIIWIVVLQLLSAARAFFLLLCVATLLFFL